MAGAIGYMASGAYLHRAWNERQFQPRDAAFSLLKAVQCALLGNGVQALIRGGTSYSFALRKIAFTVGRQGVHALALVALLELVSRVAAWKWPAARAEVCPPPPWVPYGDAGMLL